MPTPKVSLLADGAEVHEGLANLRDELGIELEHPADVVAETVSAIAAARRDEVRTAGGERADRTGLELVTIDPPGSRDLDQAFGAQRRTGGGYRVWYAIADVAAFVAPNSLLDDECHRRGVTMYAPDARAPLHPVALSEGAASLLPDGERPALLWTIDLDADGQPAMTRFERAVVRSRAQLTYADVMHDLASGAPSDTSLLLREVGELRQQVERGRGGVSLPLPEQVVERDGDHYRLAHDAPIPSEDWNAQISLLAGIEAARIMLEGGTGLLRTLEAPDQRALDRIRHAARALGIPWNAGVDYPTFVRSVDPATSAGAALLLQAARALRGAGYEAFDGAPPDHPVHGAVAAPYAHVTAPLRRLCDRATNEIVLAHVEGRAIPDWARHDLERLPKVMGEARRRESSYNRGIVDLVEALVLRPLVGSEFEGVVVDVDGDTRAQVQLREPAVDAWARTAQPTRPGDEVVVTLRAADPRERRVDLEITR